MNILQILPELNVGGVERGTVDFAKYLVLHGHKSVVVSNGGELVYILEKQGSIHYKLPVHKKSIFSILKLIKELRKIIINEKIDIVHARSRVPAWIAYFACKRTNASFITTCHGFYKSLWLSRVMGWAKLVIVPSEVIGRHMIDDFNVSSESIRCIPRSVDMDNFNIVKEGKKGQSSFTVAIVGRITPLKGHIYFLKAMAKVSRSIPYAKFWVIGDAPLDKQAYKQELQLLVEKLGIKRNVEFLGNRKDIPELLAKTDVLVFPSTVPESFGRVILEAQAVGVPVVASSIGGVVDIIDNEKTGLLVQPKDFEGIAKAVLRISKDKELVDNLTKEAQNKLREKFTLSQMAEKTIKVYEELLAFTNILVIKLSSVGDVVLVTGTLKALRDSFPKANIYCLVGYESIKVLQKCPYINGLIAFDSKDREFFNLLNLAKKLRSFNFDKIIDFQNSRMSHLLCWLSFPRESYGYNRKWGFLLTNPLKKYYRDLPAVKHQFQLLNLLNLTYPENIKLELWPSKNDQQYVKRLLESEWLSDNHNIVGINLAASEKWQTKNWPIAYVAKLCDILSRKNIRVVITGLEKDREKVKELLTKTKSRPINLVGKTDILQLAVLIKRCNVYLTPDSAPLHIAAAMGVPTIVFFGPTDSKRHVPPGKDLIVMERKLVCAPCYSTRCRIITHACMHEISPEEVVKVIDKFMKGKDIEDTVSNNAS